MSTPSDRFPGFHWGRYSKLLRVLASSPVTLAGATDQGQCSSPMIQRALTAVVAFALVAGCATQDASPPASPQVTACQEAEKILGDLSLNDAQTAAALRAIETDNQGLAEAIEETARGFADGDASIPDTITPVCRGDVDGVPELTEDHRRFLEDTRALNPSLDSVGDNDLLASIDLACDGLDLGEPSNRDQLLGLPYPLLPDFEDGEAVLRAGVPIFCSQHQQLVDDLL